MIVLCLFSLSFLATGSTVAAIRKSWFRSYVQGAFFIGGFAGDRAEQSSSRDRGVSSGKRENIERSFKWALSGQRCFDVVTTKTGLSIKRLKISAALLLPLVLQSTQNYAFSAKWITIIANRVSVHRLGMSALHKGGFLFSWSSGVGDADNMIFEKYDVIIRWVVIQGMHLEAERVLVFFFFANEL